MKAYEAAPPVTGAGATAGPVGRLRDKMAPPIPGSAFWGWAGPILVTLFGAFLRFNRLSLPHAVVFDETYYVPDTLSILKHGVELNHVSNVNPLLLKGDTHILLRTGEIVAHPPLGKYAMAIGQWLFGLTPFGWRFSVALFGSLAILMVARIARRMTRSTLLGCVAGLLLALDGLELVLSRTAILDIFVMFWVLAAFGLLVLDRDKTRARLADAADQLDPESFHDPRVVEVGDADGGGAPDAGPAAEPDEAERASAELSAVFPAMPRLSAEDKDRLGGPKLGIRWLRVAAGVCLGAACASKWNGIWFLFAFGCLAIAWDLGARHAAGFKDRVYGVFRSDARWLPLWFGVIPAAVYTLSWTGWFVSSNGYDRNWAAANGNHTPIWGSIDSWYQYNKWMLGFGLGLDAPKQPYKSNPIGWLVLQRPISFYWSASSHSCGSKSCASEVLAIGTPAIWWGASLALLFCLGWWLWRLIGDMALSRPAQRDWRAGAVLLCVAAGWLPWIWFYLHDHRTEFFYYAVAFDPFLCIAITLCLGLIIGPAAASSTRRAVGAVVAGGYLLLVLLNLAYIYPILTAEIIPYSDWLSRMWFHSWI